MRTKIGPARRPMSLRGVAAAAALLTGLFAAAACGSDDGDKAGVVVERPGNFRVELPAGWRVILPEPNVHEDRVPLFAAGPVKGGERLSVVLFTESGTDLGAKAQEWRELVTYELGDFARESDSSRDMMIATGSGTLVPSGLRVGVVLAVMRSPKLPEKMWVFYCHAIDLAKSPCEKLVRGFTLLQ